MKTEHAGPKFQLINGSRTEFFGGFWYASFGKPEKEPGMEIKDSQAVMTCQRQHSFGKGKWPTWFKATKDGKSEVHSGHAADFLCVGIEK